MKTIAALLMMTSVAGACGSPYESGCYPLPIGGWFELPAKTKWKKPIPSGCSATKEGGFFCKNINGECDYLSFDTGCSGSAAPKFTMAPDGTVCIDRSPAEGPCPSFVRGTTSVSTPFVQGTTSVSTLVLRDKRGVTMLIRGIGDKSVISGNPRYPEEACKFLAEWLKESPDIESAECFK